MTLKSRNIDVLRGACFTSVLSLVLPLFRSSPLWRRAFLPLQSQQLLVHLSKSHYALCAHKLTTTELEPLARRYSKEVVPFGQEAASSRARHLQLQRSNRRRGPLSFYDARLLISSSPSLSKRVTSWHFYHCVRQTKTKNGTRVAYCARWKEHLCVRVW